MRNRFKMSGETKDTDIDCIFHKIICYFLDFKSLNQMYLAGIVIY